MAEKACGMPQKVYKKSSAFWKHGKNKGTLQAILGEEKRKIRRPKEKMYKSVKDLMASKDRKK